MQEKSFNLLTDLNKIVQILEKIPLQHVGSRRDLAHIAKRKHMLSHEFGDVFLITLKKGNSYRTPERQREVCEDCKRLRTIVQIYLYGGSTDWMEWSEKIKEKTIPFSTWVHKPAYYYLQQLSAERERQVFMDAARRQQNDLKVMAALAGRMNLETQEQVDVLYEYLQRSEKPFFQTWIGRGFVEQLQKRTSNHRKKQSQRKILHVCSATSLTCAVLLIGILARNQAIRGREQWKNQVWNEIHTEQMASLENAKDREASQTETGIKLQDEEIQTRQESDVPTSMAQPETIRAQTETDNEEPTSTKENQIESAEEKPKILKQYQKLHAKNPDLLGWLSIDGVKLSLPVLQRAQEEDFYLTHDFEGAESKSGALFVAANTSIAPQDKNIVIYGHNMSSGEMFGNMDAYRDKAFWEGNRDFTFDTLYEEGTYEIVSVIKTHIRKEDEDGFRYYDFYNYTTKDEIQELIDFLKENQLYDTGITPKYGDSFVMLSTCEYSQEEGRLVIVGRRERKKAL